MLRRREGVFVSLRISRSSNLSQICRDRHARVLEIHVFPANAK